MAPLTCSKRKPVEYTIFLLSPRCSFPSPPFISLAPSPPRRSPLFVSLPTTIYCPLTRSEAFLIPSYSVFLACMPCTPWRGRGCGRSGVPHRERRPLCWGAIIKRLHMQQESATWPLHFFFPTINCLQWTRRQTRRFTLLSRTEILLF